MKPFHSRCASTSLFVAWVLQGCAVPQPAIDQANNAANTMQTLQTQLDALTAIEAEVAKGRIASIRQQRQLALEYENADKLNQRVAAVVNRASTSDLTTVLQGLSDSLAQDAQTLQSALAALDDQLAKLVVDAPSVAKQVAQAQKDISALGLQRGGQERIKFVQDFARTVTTDMDKQAKPPTPSASTPVQAHPPAPASSSTNLAL